MSGSTGEAALRGGRHHATFAILGFTLASILAHMVPMLAVFSSALIVAGIVVLALSGSWMPGAVVFAICVGLGSGINSIAQGSLPVYLFGGGGYGAVTGRMPAVRLALGAAAPVAIERLGLGLSLYFTAALGAVAIGAFTSVATSIELELVPAG